MATALTLNNVLKRLEVFASNHHFINTFSFGSPEDIDKTDGVQYPLMHVIQNGSNKDYNDNKKTYDLSIVFADRPTESSDKVGHQAQVQSDMEQCAEDLENDIRNGGVIFSNSELWGIDSNGIEYFDEDNSNSLSGGVLSIGITVPYPLNSCAIPITGYTPTSTECADATVENSNASYQVNVASGGTLVVPDTPITNSNDTFAAVTPSTIEYSIPDIIVKGTDSADAVTTIATIPFAVAGYTHTKIKVLDQSDVQAGTGRVAKNIKIVGADVTSVTESATEILVTPTVPVCATPSGICYQSAILSQVTSYRTGDEGWQIANSIWDTTDPTYPIHKARLDFDAADPFFTMLADNAFGNRSRFTDEAGTAAVKKVSTSSGLVIDHLTGLMWYAIASGQVDWNTAIDTPLASSQSGYTDWYLAPRHFIDNINPSAAATDGVPGFRVADMNDAWTATTISASTGRAYIYYSTSSIIVGYFTTKISAIRNYVMVRQHY